MATEEAVESTASSDFITSELRQF